MRVNKKIIKLLFLCIFAFLPISVFAVSVTSGSQVSAGLSYANYKYINGTEVICTQFDKPAPSSCSASSNLTSAVKAGAGYIIAWRNNGGNYVCAEKLLTKYMFHTYKKDGRANYDIYYDNWAGNCGMTRDEVQTLFNNSMSEYNKVNNIPKVTFTSSSLSFSASGDNYVASVGVNSYGYNFSCSSNIGYASEGNGYATVTVNKNNYNQEITLTCRTYYGYSAPTAYYTCKSAQEVITASTTSETVYGVQNSISGSFSKPQGNLKIAKKRTGTDKLSTLTNLNEFAKTTYFKLYSDSNCSTVKEDCNDELYGCSMKGSSYTFEDLDAGTYYLKETKAKRGYHTPEPGEKWFCEPVTVTAGENDPITVLNCIFNLLL